MNSLPHQFYEENILHVTLIGKIKDFDESILSLAADQSSEEYYANMMTAWLFAEALAKQWDVAVTYIEGISEEFKDKIVHLIIQIFRLRLFTIMELGLNHRYKAIIMR